MLLAMLGLTGGKSFYSRSSLFSPKSKDDAYDIHHQDASRGLALSEQDLRVSNNNVKISVVNLVSNLGSCILCAYMLRSFFRGLSESFTYFINKVNSGVGGGNSSLSLGDVSRFLGNETLNNYEAEIAVSIIDPATIDVDFRDIGGLKDVKRSLLDCSSSLISLDDGGVDRSVAQLPSNALYKSVGGVLLYGPPGCGKSALVRALAKRMNIPVLPLQPSSLLRKYVGESSQLCKAVFTLADKLSPCILFLDEMDSLFRSRQDEDNSVDRNLKTEFMQLWDSLSRSNPGVLVVGATNRPQDIDSAIQRRFERSFLIGLPNEPARIEIFRLLLKTTLLDNDFDFSQCAAATEGYTPSDILNVCKAAAQVPLREYKRRHRGAVDINLKDGSVASGRGESTAKEVSTKAPALRPLRWTDVLEALQTVYPTQWLANSYGNFSPRSPQAGHGSDISYQGNAEDDQSDDSL